MFRPHQHVALAQSTWKRHQHQKNFIVNQQETNKSSIILDHCVANNFLLISVAAAIIYVRSHVNVPFRQIQSKISAFHQYLLNKFVRVHHRSIQPFIIIKKIEPFIDFILSTDHLHRHLFEHDFIETQTRQISLPKSSLSIVLLFLLFPLTFATKLPSTTKFDLLIVNNYTFSFSSNTSQELFWNAGCCIRRLNSTMCDARFYSPSPGHSVYASNDTSSGTFLFDGVSHFIDRRQLFHTPYGLHNYDFLNNQSLFCQRYDEFRHISANPYAVFTYFIVVIGIIFNSFVFTVLIFGSLRRSNSFALFLALTVFDLMSLASSLFALLFRTVMTHLKSSAIFCKMFGIFFLYFRQCSSTTLLLIALERCIVIKYPFCRYVFDKCRLGSLILIMLIFAVPIPFDFIFYTSGQLHCEAFDTPHADRYQIFRGFFTVFTYAMIPFFGIAISNLLIIIELKNSKKRLMVKNEDGTKSNPSTNLAENRSTTIMLFVASFAFILLLGPFYLHWCITYLFYYYKQCHFTRNLYENVQVCMGVSNPYLTVIEKGMRESNHAINFLLYISTSTRFRADFKRICRRIYFKTCYSTILFFCRHVCKCFAESSWITSLEQTMSDSIEQETAIEKSRKYNAAYKTSHYYSNFERRRQNQLIQATISDSNSTSIGATLSPKTPYAASPQIGTGKTARTLTWNPYDPIVREKESKRQAERLSQHFVT